MFYGFSASSSAPIKQMLSSVFISGPGKLSPPQHVWQKRDELHPSVTPLVCCELSLWFLTPICAQYEFKALTISGSLIFPYVSFLLHLLKLFADLPLLCLQGLHNPGLTHVVLLHRLWVNHGNVNNIKNHWAKTLCLEPSSSTTQNTSQMAHQLSIKPSVSIFALASRAHLRSSEILENKQMKEMVSFAVRRVIRISRRLTCEDQKKGNMPKAEWNKICLRSSFR